MCLCKAKSRTTNNNMNTLKGIIIIAIALLTVSCHVDKEYSLKKDNINYEINAGQQIVVPIGSFSTITTYGWEFGGMVNVYAKKFSAFMGTDSYFYHMTPHLVPVNNFNTHVVFGVSYLLSRNPWVKRQKR